MKSIKSFTLDQISEALGVDRKAAKALRKAVNGLPNSTWFYRKAWNRRAEEVLSQADKLMNAFGVEAFVVTVGKENRLVSYVNTGDGYNTTILAYNGKIYIGCWADLAERYPSPEGSDAFLEF